MSEIVVSYVGAMPRHLSGQPPVADLHSFAPCFEAKRGEELFLKAWVQLTGFAAAIAMARLVPAEDGEAAAAPLDRVLLRYGVRRLEATVQDLLVSGTEPEEVGQTWILTQDDLPELFALASGKSCEYQRRQRRDVFCLTPSIKDPTAAYLVDEVRAAPTSTATCRACDLPDTDYLCSNFLHPQVSTTQTFPANNRRFVVGGICDQARPEVHDRGGCRAGGHACWQRTVVLEAPSVDPVSPLALTEALDTLDALWRLAFGRKKRLLAVSTASGTAALALNCTSRAEFESRLSALADIIDRLAVEPSLLPSGLTDEDIPGSLAKLEHALLHQMPAEHHPAVLDALRTIRRVRQTRNALQHGITEGGGVTAKLRELGIHDAPPNWGNAWDAVRVHTASALNILRNELRKWVDSTP